MTPNDVIKIRCYVIIWFKPRIDDEFWEISTCNVVRHGRTYIDRGYDIPLYIEGGLNSKIVLKSDEDSVVEYLGIEISATAMDRAYNHSLCNV
uniref:Uncharacterized protein n=1 Tax=Glossina pallidipes TaxID=7398 RepID=A0A1B0A7Q2_GLOPL